ncbi:MAG: cobalamin-binding protein [Sulfuricellaceae bacterium]|nr:cobalamin-binding protein [Sulfuricellaceae bacterium]
MLGSLLLIVQQQALAGTLVVRDDTGLTITLTRPAQRIVSLAPHLTEILFAVGAGAQVVGTVEYSDYPSEAKRLPRVGSYVQFDMERIVAMRPDLIVAWQSGNNQAQVAQLRKMGYRVFLNEPRRILDVAASLERIGVLAGRGEQAARQSSMFRARHAELQARYSQRRPVRTFYEVWNKPLMTVSGQHLIGDVMKLCGAENVFSGLSVLTPTIDVEAVVAAAPEVIIASGMDESRPEWLDDWRRWPNMKAVRQHHLYFVPPDLLHRHTPRILDGAEMFCEQVDRARK